MIRMSDKEVLSRYTALVMRLQDEYHKAVQDFEKQRSIENEVALLKHEIFSRMELVHNE